MNAIALHGECKTPGGKLVVVDCSLVDGRLHDVQISGDFFLFPDDALARLTAAVEGSLADRSIADRAAAIEVHIKSNDVLLGINAEAIAIAIERALESR